MKKIKPEARKEVLLSLNKVKNRLLGMGLMRRKGPDDKKILTIVQDEINLYHDHQIDLFNPLEILEDRKWSLGSIVLFNGGKDIIVRWRVMSSIGGVMGSGSTIADAVLEAVEREQDKSRQFFDELIADAHDREL